MPRVALRGAVGLLCAAMSAAVLLRETSPPLTGLALEAAGADGAPAPRRGAVQASAASSDRSAYFGDLHVHTNWSLDAYAMGGNTADGPEVAYRYGRGDAITRPDGSIRGKLRVPLDFMAVTDHDNFLGEVHLCTDQKDSAYDTPTCQDIRGLKGIGKVFGPYHRNALRPPDICGGNGMGPQNKCYELSKHLWHEIQKNAAAFNVPGKFTTFPAYEWTANPPGYGHLHRVVIFRGEQVPEWGGSAVEMKNQPERLWEWLEKACTGDCQVVGIPHNTNLSEGIALASTNSDGSAFTTEILKRRAWAEPLIEIHQIKGNSECFAGLGTTDEECNFENYMAICKPGEEGMCAHASDFVRNALKTGLTLEAKFGVNPFKFGIAANSDDHKSQPGATDERGFEGWFGELGGKIRPYRTGVEDNPGGLFGVWADENTRPAIFAALRRRETFGTSGPRIRIRFFGGWTYPDNLHRSRNLAQEAYKGGVTMGSDLPGRPTSARAPRFVVWATKDPAAGTLQKIQIVKGWTEGAETREKVFDVVCSDGLTPDSRTHQCRDNGATVDLATCTVTRGKGAPELSATWADPEFNPAERAFYYPRVLENPSCRWTMLRASANRSDPPAAVPAIIKERAWGSPIWYTPPAR